MKLSVVFEDGTIVKDGASKSGFAFDLVDPNWHALQWLGSEGWIEVKQGERIWLSTDETPLLLAELFDAQVPPPPPPVNPVPESVTPRQVRLLLLGQGLLDQVEQIIAASDRATQITWEFASEFQRDNPLLLALAQNLNLTEAQVDEFFIAAAAI